MQIALFLRGRDGVSVDLPGGVGQAKLFLKRPQFQVRCAIFLITGDGFSVLDNGVLKLPRIAVQIGQTEAGERIIRENLKNLQEFLLPLRVKRFHNTYL